MKKILCMILAFGCVWTLAACGSQQPMQQNQTQQSGGQTDAITRSTEDDTWEEEQREALKDGYYKITAEEAKKMLDAGGVTMVDVRTQAEYDQGHIEGAISLHEDQIGDDPLERQAVIQALPDTEAVILVYGRGDDSEDAGEELAELGYRNVYEFGSLQYWTGELITD